MREGAVSGQIEAFFNAELARMKARCARVGENAEPCGGCAAVPGFKLGAVSVQERDAGLKAGGGMNRRGSKDRQLSEQGDIISAVQSVFLDL